MQDMKEKMEKSMQEAESKELEEDINSLRGILENLIQLSYDQELLMKDLEKITGYNPQFVAAGQKQKDLKDDAKIIEDSLFALSKRQIKIEAFINREIGNINIPAVIFFNLILFLIAISYYFECSPWLT